MKRFILLGALFVAGGLALYGIWCCLMEGCEYVCRCVHEMLGVF